MGFHIYLALPKGRCHNNSLPEWDRLCLLLRQTERAQPTECGVRLQRASSYTWVCLKIVFTPKGSSLHVVIWCLTLLNQWNLRCPCSDKLIPSMGLAPKDWDPPRICAVPWTWRLSLLSDWINAVERVITSHRWLVKPFRVKLEMVYNGGLATLGWFMLVRIPTNGVWHSPIIIFMYILVSKIDQKSLLLSLRFNRKSRLAHQRARLASRSLRQGKSRWKSRWAGASSWKWDDSVTRL